MADGLGSDGLGSAKSTATSFQSHRGRDHHKCHVSCVTDACSRPADGASHSEMSSASSSLPAVVLQWLASHSLGGTEWSLVQELTEIGVKSLGDLDFVAVEDLKSCSTIVKRRFVRAVGEWMASVHG